MIGRLLRQAACLQQVQKYGYQVIKDEIKLTEACLKRIHQKINASKNADTNFLRLVVESGEGCGGFTYKFKFDTASQEDDFVYKENDKIIFAMDQLTLKFVKGSIIDFETTMMRSAFYVNSNPNSEKNCSCKASFSPKESVFQ